MVNSDPGKVQLDRNLQASYTVSTRVPDYPDEDDDDGLSPPVSTNKSLAFCKTQSMVDVHQRQNRVSYLEVKLNASRHNRGESMEPNFFSECSLRPLKQGNHAGRAASQQDQLDMDGMMEKWKPTYDKLLKMSKCENIWSSMEAISHRKRLVAINTCKAKRDNDEDDIGIETYDMANRSGTFEGLDVGKLKRWFGSRKTRTDPVQPDPCGPPQKIARLISIADIDGDGVLTEREFYAMMLDYCEKNMPETCQKNIKTWEREWKTLAAADIYRCCPPPLFLPAISVIQVAVFLHYHGGQEYHHLMKTPYNPAMMCSLLVLNPERRWLEPWRFLSYGLVHVNTSHLVLNVVGQLLVGLPLEFSHSSWRVFLVYLGGVLAGGLGRSALSQKMPNSNLAGASGGLYALFTSHVASLALNWKADVFLLLQRFRSGKPARMLYAPKIRTFRTAAVCIMITTEVANGVYEKLYSCRPPNSLTTTLESMEEDPAAADGGGYCFTPTSYTAHVSGALAGLLVGFLVLKDRWKGGCKNGIKVGVLLVLVLSLSALIYLDVRSALGSGHVRFRNESAVVVDGPEACPWAKYHQACLTKCDHQHTGTIGSQNNHNSNDDKMQNFNCTVSLC